MNKLHTYRPTDKMSDLICDNYSLLMVMSRFGLSLGFGEKSVKEVCEAQEVDCDTFLAVVNFINNPTEKHAADEPVACSPTALMNYLKRAHHYFLNFSLPAIRRKLIEAIDCSHDDEVAFLILKFYDDYAKEVRRHMEYENLSVFTYVENLLQGRLCEDFNIATFASKHSQVEVKLTELKNIIIKYYQAKENDLLNAVLFDIFNCEQDLASHCKVEDCLFVPLVKRMEKELKENLKNGSVQEHAPNAEMEEGEESLSQREREVIGCVAKGMSNKEIAQHLYLSIHTVITHRRNIARKLQIHSPAGLTIYAIVNKLVKLDEVKQG